MQLSQNRPGVLWQILSFLASSFLLTIFLGYIDEGNYSFDGMLDSQNIPALFIYSIMFLGAQLFIARVVLRSYKGRFLILFSIGFFIAFLLLMFLLTLLHAIVYDKL